MNTLARVECQDFAVSFDGSEDHKSSMEIALRSLIMEDLQVPEDDDHRMLATSVSKDGDGLRGGLGASNLLSG